MRYFVTGATGFVGGRVARQLLADGHSVVAIARDADAASDLAQLGAEVRAGDITEKESMRDAMAGVDGIFHIAGWYKIGTRKKIAGSLINVEGTRNVLELMREQGISKGVYTSTLAVFSDTHGKLVDETYRYNGHSFLSEYDRTKWLAHYEVAEPMIREGLPLVIVQPGAIYGPGDPSPLGATFAQYLRRKLPLVPGRTAFSWAHVEDAARGHLLAMERGRTGEDYIIAGPTHTLIEALAMAQRITNIPAPRLHAPPALVKLMAASMGIAEHVLPVPDEYTQEYLRVSAGVTYIGSNAKARRELGYNPRPLEEGLAETLDYEMRRLGLKR